MSRPQKHECSESAVLNELSKFYTLVGHDSETQLPSVKKLNCITLLLYHV